jgi:hypothetical protein
MGATIDERVQSALQWLREHATQATLDGMARYAIPSDHALGVAVRDIKALGQQLGRDQALVASEDAAGRWIGRDALRELKPAARATAPQKRVSVT